MAVQFADFHDTPGRMLEKGVISVRATAAVWGAKSLPCFPKRGGHLGSGGLGMGQMLQMGDTWELSNNPDPQMALQTNEIQTPGQEPGSHDF